jgi:ATP-dependent protease HslVU (ClpYQ) ATPase subunit
VFWHVNAVQASIKYLLAAGAFAVAIPEHIVRDLSGRVPSACFTNIAGFQSTKILLRFDGTCAKKSA